MQLHRYRFVPAWLILAMTFAGCTEGPAIAPVSGVVTYNGEPVKYAKVMFFPQNVPGGGLGMAQADDAGRFSKVITAGADTPGAVVGSHFVTVTEGWPPGMEIPVSGLGMPLPPPRGPWAQKYRDSANPEIKVNVVADRENHFEFDLSK